MTLSSPGERIPLVIVGLGRRGSQWVPVVRSTSPYELVACVETDPRTLREAAARLSIPSDRCYARLDEALDRTPARAGIIATPVDAHVEPCRVALERGVGVLVEKPFALSLAEAQHLVATAEAAKTALVVGQNYRYTRMPQAVRRLLSDGVLGRIGMFVCQAYRGNGTGEAPWLAGVPHSVLWETAVHHLDALRYMRAERLVGVMAESFAVPWVAPLRGAAFHCLLEFEDGVRGAYSATYGSVGHALFEGGNQFLLRIVGERGTLHVWQRWILLCERGRMPRLVHRPATADRSPHPGHRGRGGSPSAPAPDPGAWPRRPAVRRQRHSPDDGRVGTAPPRPGRDRLVRARGRRADARVPAQVGGIHRWVDQDLLAELARRLPQASFVLVGPRQTDVARLEPLPNVHLVGARPHREALRYVKEFDVGLVPYRLTEYTAHVYPTKLNEYLAMGIPVVATDLPEILRFNAEHGDVVRVARTPDGFAAAVRAASDERSATESQRRIGVARRNDWDERIPRMLELIGHGEPVRARAT